MSRYLIEGKYVYSIVEAKNKEDAAFDFINKGHAAGIDNGVVKVSVSEIMESEDVVIKVKLSI